MTFPRQPIAKTYGRWTVIGDRVKTPSGHYKVPCRCSCGTEALVDLSNLRKGTSKGCFECLADRLREPERMNHTLVTGLIKRIKDVGLDDLSQLSAAVANEINSRQNAK